MYMNTFSIGPGDGALFDQYVSNKPAFVKFYHPGCYHCNEMAPAWKELERKVNGASVNASDILIIEVHADAVNDIKSDCARHIRGYPTIMEVKEGGIAGKEHHGSRDSETLLNFLHTNIQPPIRRKRIDAIENVITKTKRKTKRKTKTKSHDRMKSRRNINRRTKRRTRTKMTKQLKVKPNRQTQKRKKN